MVHAINKFSDEATEKRLMQSLGVYYDEVRAMLPRLPGDLQIYFDDFCIVDGTGVGGFAYDHDIITIGYDSHFKDKAMQERNLRSALFHEAYHLSHGYHSQMGTISAIEETIYEGAATVFERDVAKNFPPYGDYSGKPVKEWFHSIKTIGSPIGSKVWNAWKFFDESDHEKWKMYKTGCYIVDQAMSKSGKTIIELNDLDAAAILALSDLD